MFAFLKKWFGDKGHGHAGQERPTDPVLDLGPAAEPEETAQKIPHADVHQLMIRATAIRRNKGYHEAVLFLQDLAEHYLKEQNTALVTCVYKLVPYMKKDPELTYKKAYEWFRDLINRLPENDPYFLNVHITMAELLEMESAEKAIAYLEQFLQQHRPSTDTYYHLIRLADFYREQRDRKKALNYMEQARQWWDTSLDRYLLIKMQRRWHHSTALLAFGGNGNKDLSDYLFHRFMEFALDMARVLYPAQIDEFHKRKDQYFKGERGFANMTTFEKTISALDLKEKRNSLIRHIEGFVFEEMPMILGVTEKQLHFQPGDPETLEEVRQKKTFPKRPFTQEKELEDRIRKIVDEVTD